MLKTELQMGVDDAFTTDDLLKENGLKTLSVPTVYRWLWKLGFKYKVRKKCYYVDMHKKPENVRFQKAFVKD